MVEPDIKLYLHQSDDLQALTSYVLEWENGLDEPNKNHLKILYPTGAGKTTMALTLFAKLRDMGLATHAVFAAPSAVIMRAFEGGEVVYDPFTGQTFEQPEVRDVDGGATSRILNYVSETENNDGATYRTSHNAMALLRGRLANLIAENPGLTHRKVLVIDEAHHAGKYKTALADVRDIWCEGGGLVVSLTATPDRTDKYEVIPKGVKGVTRPMTRQMGKFAPSVLLSEVRFVEGPAKSDKDDFYCPVDPDRIAQYIAEHLEQEKCDRGYKVKAVARLKALGESVNHRSVFLRVGEELRKLGYRVYVESAAHNKENVGRSKKEEQGEAREKARAERRIIEAWNREIMDAVRAKYAEQGRDDKVETFNDVLKYENRLTDVEDSCLDVVLGMSSILEGFNWKLCSHVYFLGVPSGLPPIVQGVGRAMRLRKEQFGERYSPKWLDTSKVVFLVSGEAEEVKESHRAKVIELSCYMAAFRTMPEDEISKVLSKRVGGDEKKENAIESAMNRVAMDDGTRQAIFSYIEAINLLFAKHPDAWPKSTGGMTVGQVVAMVLMLAKHFKENDITEAQIKSVLMSYNPKIMKKYIDYVTGQITGNEDVDTLVQIVQNGYEGAGIDDEVVQTSPASEISTSYFQEEAASRARTEKLGSEIVAITKEFAEGAAIRAGVMKPEDLVSSVENAVKA